MAGDAQGATLAWAHDTDGRITTRSDWRIAVTQWNTATNQWGQVDLLEAITALTATVQARAAQIEPEREQPAGLAPELTSDALNASAAELHVCATCPYTNIQAAVDAAGTGDIVKVATGSYTGVQARTAYT